jgi:hypothetical protein
MSAALAFAALPAAAQHEHQHGDKPAAAPAMTPEQQKMMQNWEKAMTPGPQHAELAAMAGTWTFTGSSRMSPDAPPDTFSGTEVRTMALGGRVLVSKVDSAFQGQPFEGHGMLGYDNVSGKWWSTWNDNMSTGVMVATGSCANGTCEFSGTFNDPMTGQLKTSRMTSTHQADREEHVMYDRTPDGKEYKSMEFLYTRKK